jgi:hypothetical protein
MRVAWTGHRPDLFRDPEAARQRVDDIARGLAQTTPEVTFVVGGQRGVDTGAAGTAHGLGIQFCAPSAART